MVALLATALILSLLWALRMHVVVNDNKRVLNGVYDTVQSYKRNPSIQSYELVSSLEAQLKPYVES